MSKYLISLLFAISLAGQGVVVIPGGIGTIPGSNSGGGGGGSVIAGTGIDVVGSTVSIDSSYTATRAGVQSGEDNTCTDSGGDDAYTCTLLYSLPSYTTGMQLKLKVTTANTGEATVNAGPGVKIIKTASGGTLANGDIVVGAINVMYYDGTDFRLGSTGGGAAISSTPPYLTIAGSLYLPQFGYAVTLPPASGSWTNVNTANALAAGGNGSLLFTGKNTSGAVTGFKIARGGSNVLEAAIACNGAKAGGSAYGAGIGAMDAGGGIFLLGGGPGGGFDGAADVSVWANATTLSFYSTAPQTSSIFLRISVSGTTVTFAVSPDGVNWKNALNTRTMTVTDWMFGSSGNGTDAATCNLLSWKTT